MMMLMMMMTTMTIRLLKTISLFAALFRDNLRESVTLYIIFVENNIY